MRYFLARNLNGCGSVPQSIWKNKMLQSCLNSTRLELVTLNSSCLKWSSLNSRNFLRQRWQKSGKKIRPLLEIVGGLLYILICRWIKHMLSNTPTSPPCQSLEFFLTSFPFHTAYQPPETLHINHLKYCISNNWNIAYQTTENRNQVCWKCRFFKWKWEYCDGIIYFGENLRNIETNCWHNLVWISPLAHWEKCQEPS